MPPQGFVCCRPGVNAVCDGSLKPSRAKDLFLLDRGAVVRSGDSAELLADRDQLDRWLAVAKQ